MSSVVGVHTINSVVLPTIYKKNATVETSCKITAMFTKPLMVMVVIKTYIQGIFS